MRTIRRRVRLWAFAWFLCQALTLVALVPRDCCAHHRPAAPAQAAPHEASGAAPATPSCPMHAAPRPTPSPGDDHGPTHHQNSRGTVAAGDTDDDCVMRGTCDGPPLFTFLSQAGVLPEVSRLAVRLSTPASVPLHAPSVIGRAEPPDPLPPRASSPLL
jgi:hypothetical protein